MSAKISRFTAALRQRLRRLRRREDGTATIEFALVVPVATLIFMASMEAGLFMIRQTLMERGLDLSLRDFRLGKMLSLSHDQIRDEICDQTVLIPDCRSQMKVWMEPLDTVTWNIAATPVFCGNQNNPLIQPLSGEIQPTDAHQLVLIRVCLLQDPIFPSTGFSLRLREHSQTGQYEIATSTVVISEPR